MLYTLIIFFTILKFVHSNLYVCGYCATTLSFAIIFVTIIKIVICGTLVARVFNYRCDNNKVPTNIVIIGVITFCACGMDWMKTR